MKEEEPRELDAAQAPQEAPPPPPDAPEVPRTLQPLYEVVDQLSSQSQMYTQLAQLRHQLREERNPLRQLGLIQEFVKSGAADTRELREAFYHLRQEIGQDAPHFLSRVLLPLLHQGKR